MVLAQPAAPAAPPASDMPRPYTYEEFESLASSYPDLRIELTATGKLIIMPPAGSESSRKNFQISLQLGRWSEADGSGEAFDSSAGFTLPNGALRSPDTAWIERSRWESLTPEQRRKFAPLCPDFVVELVSDTDSLSDTQEKMREYIANGARLGWLIDPRTRRVEVYQPGQEVEALDNPQTVSGDPVLPGFVLNLEPIWT